MEGKDDGRDMEQGRKERKVEGREEGRGGVYV